MSHERPYNEFNFTLILLIIFIVWQFSPRTIKKLQLDHGRKGLYALLHDIKYWKLHECCKEVHPKKYNKMTHVHVMGT